MHEKLVCSARLRTKGSCTAAEANSIASSSNSKDPEEQGEEEE